jgi:transcriptional regulator with XRE-family HTH domain
MTTTTGKVIRSLRVRAGLDQKAFGLGIGVAQNTISHYENDIRMPDPRREGRRIVEFARAHGFRAPGSRRPFSLDDLYPPINNNA